MRVIYPDIFFFAISCVHDASHSVKSTDLENHSPLSAVCPARFQIQVFRAVYQRGSTHWSVVTVTVSVTDVSQHHQELSACCSAQAAP